MTYIFPGCREFQYVCGLYLLSTLCVPHLHHHSGLLALSPNLSNQHLLRKFLNPRHKRHSLLLRHTKIKSCVSFNSPSPLFNSRIYDYSNYSTNCVALLIVSCRSLLIIIELLRPISCHTTITTETWLRVAHHT